LPNCRKKPPTFGGFFEIPQKTAQIKEIDARLTDPAIWSKPQESAKLAKEKKILNSFVKIDQKLNTAIEELDTYLLLIDEDPDLLPELEQKIALLQEYVEETEIKHYLNGDNDASNAFLSIHPGAGGTESQDWAEILLRMYLRFGERMGFKAEITDILAGEEAGVKSVTVRYEGEFAFGYLKEEIGVHRLVRISPFDANKRRHTSFAAVFVIPEVDDSITIDIDAKDLRIDTYRSSGKGGQHVNRTDSAVRITHLPTNTVAQCQSERSQHQNKDQAMKMLRSRLYDLEMKKQQRVKDKIEDSKGGIAWGNQIRSYVLHPYQSIKDHRTSIERGDTQRVLDGDIIGFIKESLKLPR
jgi:peptide chain release factor 2